MKVEPVAWANYREDGMIVGVTSVQEDYKNWRNKTPLYAIPPGYALVRVEPTEAMITAMVVGSYGELPPKQNEFHAAEFAIMRDAYKAMIAAAKGE